MDLERTRSKKQGLQRCRCYGNEDGHYVRSCIIWVILPVLAELLRCGVSDSTGEFGSLVSLLGAHSCCV